MKQRKFSLVQLASSLLLMLFLFLWLNASICNSLELDYSVVSIHRLLRRGKTNCTDVISHFMRRAAIYSPHVMLNPQSLAQARQLDLARRSCHLDRLECVPVIASDAFDVLGMPTTGGLGPLKNSFPELNAEVIEWLTAEGAIVLGKTNDSAASDCKNPYTDEASNNPCGEKKCGLVAQAISVGAAIIGLGTDSDGLAQISASYNSVNSIRLSHKMTSISGVFPSFEKQEAIIAMSKHVDDLGLTIDVISPFNNETIAEPIKHELLNKRLKDETRVGVYRFMLANLTLPYPDGRVFHYHIDRQVRSLIERSIRRLRALKFNVIEYDLSPVEVVKMLLSVYNKTQQMLESVAECSHACRRDSLDRYLARLGRDAPFTSVQAVVASPSMSGNVKTREALLSIDTNGSNMSCDDWCDNYNTYRVELEDLVADWFAKDNIDAFLMPTYLHAPSSLSISSANSSTSSSPSQQQYQRTKPATIDSLSPLAAYASYPSLNIPIGYNPKGLPVGMLLLSKPEALIKSLNVAKLFEIQYADIRLPRTAPELNKAHASFSSSRLDLCFFFVSSCGLFVLTNLI